MNAVRSVAALLTATACAVGMIVAVAGPAAAATPPRVDLKVLVVTDGTPWVEAIRQELATEGIPATVVNLADSGRPVITAGFLSDTLAGTPRAKFNGVVLPNNAPADLTAGEQDALASFESSFGVRQVDSFVYPSAAVGMNTPSYAGTLDGQTAQLSASALKGAFSYLRGPARFADNDPVVPESFGYLANPLPDDPVTQAHFEPYLTASAPDGSTTGTMAGVYSVGGRERLILGFAYNYYQQQFRWLAHGIITWLTRGVHLGFNRNYFTVHVDDVFGDDARWSDIGKCTPGSGDCPAGVPPTTPIRMTPADTNTVVQWQRANNFTLDMLFNGAGSDKIVEQDGSDPLNDAFSAVRDQFRWLNHTYTHQFLGCVRDFTVIPWRCVTDPATGQTQWVSRAAIDSEIKTNITWARDNGYPITRSEMVTAEHSGTKILPQQPVDNPHFVSALGPDGIKWIGLDASREPNQRQVGAALGVPRHPINVFYNVANPNEEVSEYNWIYTSRADGGSGICEDHPATTTCITPLDPVTGYTSYIVPTQVQITLSYVLANDPRPFYVHQSNLAEGQLLYPVLSGLLSIYREAFAANASLVSPTFTTAGDRLAKQAAWEQTLRDGSVTAYVQGGTVTVQGPTGTQVPITVPTGTRVGLVLGPQFGTAYAGERSGYTAIPRGGTLLLVVPTVPFPAPAATAAPVPHAENPPAATAAVAPTGPVATTLNRAATAAQQLLKSPEAAKIAMGR